MAQVILPDVPRVVRFAVGGLWQNLPWINVFHAQYASSSLDQTGINDAASQMLTAYHNAFGAIQSSSSHSRQCLAQDLTTRTSPIGAATLDQPGGDVAATFPTVQTAVCVSWLIPERYRGGHPRNYIPGIVQADVTAGRQLTTTAVTKWGNAAAGFLTNVNAMTAGATTWRLCCVRYFTQGSLFPNPPVRLISSSIVHSRIDSQRRRLGKEIT